MANDAGDSMMQQLRRVALMPDAGGMSDGQLLEHFVARRDEAAFEVLVRRHGPMVLSVCSRALRDRQDAEDAFQATFLVLVRKAATIRSRELLANWLYGVAYRTAMKARSMNSKRRAMERRAVEHLRPAEHDRNEALQEFVDQELTRLPERYRAIVVLCELEGKTRRDAARLVGLPEGTVSSRLARAKRILRDRLSRRVEAPPSFALPPVLVPAATLPPGTLVAGTVKAAAAVAAGKSAAEVASAQVAVLTKGVLKAMFLSKFKLAGLLVLVAGIVAGSLVAVQHVWAGRQAAPRIAASSPPGNRPRERAGIAPRPQERPVGDKVATAPRTVTAQQSSAPVLSSIEDSQALARIREKLSDPVTLEFVETPLGDLLDFLRDYTGVNILLDRQALEGEGVSGDTPVSIHVQSIKLASALNILLRSYGLTWILKDDCLRITSQTAADNHFVTRSHPVGDLVTTPVEGEKLQSLARRILGSNSGDVPTERMPLLDPLRAIVLTHNVSAHTNLARLLDQLRGGTDETESVKKIQAKLNEPVTLEFVETPLGDVFDFLRDYTGVNIVLEHRAWEEQGVTADTPVTIHVQQVVLQSALAILLDPLNLTTMTENECLIVTSKPAEQACFTLHGYPVAKMLSNRVAISRDEWRRIAHSVVGGSEATGPEEAGKKRLGRPVIEFYEPRQSLIVFGPESLQREVKNLIGLLARTPERAVK